MEMDVIKTDWEGADWIQLALDRVQWQATGNMVLNV
jgi:hypothetical protein